MLGRHVYRVSSPSEGEWIVRKDGEQKPCGSSPTRDAATALACDLAAADKPSKVVIENPDGTLGDERAFGADPGMNAVE